jgi:predicted phage baseplate assembly protein
MSLPIPNLDDRRFQDLVDDAKRLVRQRCPEWTDHNVSDPGVTLIETFAFMTDQLLFRLNRVPDRLYLKFLELIGLRLLSPTPARVPVTFWLSAPATTPLTVAAGTRVGTPRTESEQSIEFATLDDLVIAPHSIDHVRTDVARTAGEPDERALADRSDQLAMHTTFAAFGSPPTVDDALLVGLDDPAPNCAVRIEFDGRVEGIGVNPSRPPLVWEAWTGQEWTECLLGLDETGGLNRSGAVIVHVPGEHQPSVIGGDRAGWLRARVVQPEEGQPPYTEAPMVHGLAACTVGGTAEALHGEIVAAETLGESEGVPGQSFTVSRAPILAGADPIVEIGSADGWQEWTLVDHFAASAPHDRHFVLDASNGVVQFGPAVREPDGRLRRYGEVPPMGQPVRIRRYVTGGGPTGNVATGTINTLKSSIPFVAGVENLRPAQGGVAGETLTEAKVRGPLMLRARSRAVTTEDYEALARQAAPEVARVRCIPAGTGDVAAGSARVLVVPAAASDKGRVQFENLLPPADTLATIAAKLDETRVIGTRVVVEPPLYRGVTVVGRLVARPRAGLERVREDALTALYRYLNPLPGGGPEGHGWPFGRPVQAGELFGLLQQVHGVELVEDIRLFGADPVTGSRGAQTQRLDLEPNSLVFSFDHQLRVEEN